jgi:predicted protein tyrosine phosphatase
MLNRQTMIHVCSLSRLPETVQMTGARHVVTLLKDRDLIPRPDGIIKGNHLILRVDDISSPLDGYVMADHDHIEKLLTFVRGWDRAAPLVIHCFAGISRSTASAYVACCALSPHRDEAHIAQALRLASPTATPNAHIVALADRALERSGRMIDAIQTIGRGIMAEEAVPFRLELE